MSRNIVITSGKGGVGKTTIVSRLGVELSRLGYKVLLIDMDFGLNNLDVVMGIENKIVYDMIDVIEGRCSPRQALVEDFFESNLTIFPSTKNFCSKRFGSELLLRIIKEIEKNFDFILIDCPAGIDGGFRRAMECANEYIIVTTPHISAVRDADKVNNFIQSIGNVTPKLIINRARGDLILNGDMLGIDTIKNHIGAELIGVVPDDDEVSFQYADVHSFDRYSSASESINMIACYLTSKDYKIYDCTKKYRGILGGIRKSIRKRV